MSKWSVLPLLLAALASTTSLPAQAGELATLSIINSRTGERLPVWRHRGQNYIAGQPGDRYTLQLRNKTAGRLLAVVSVDGINVLSGATASVQQSGYVIDAWSQAGIDGWRKSMDEVAAFYFTRLPDSYAARTGRPDQVGVIGLALFREQLPEPVMMAPESRDAASAPGAADQSAAGPSARSAGAAAESAAPAPMSKSLARQQERLGTGHGERLHSRVSNTEFMRQQTEPNEVITVFYDTAERLQARGIMPRPRPHVRPQNPFPGDFVPDPR